MSARFEDLAARALEDGLSTAEERELLDLLRDPAREAAFADWARIDRELAGVLAAPLSDERMAELVLKDVDRPPGRDSSRFVAVMRQVRRRRETPPRSGVWFWAVAAGFLAAVLAVAVARPKPVKPAPPIVRTPAVESPPPIPPEPPAPEPHAPADKTLRDPEPLVVPPGKKEADSFIPAPPPPKKPPAVTVTAVARVDRVDGGANVRAGQDLLPGQGVETGRDGRVALRFPDGTRMDVEPASALRELDDRRALLAAGTLRAKIADRAFNLLTPEAEATLSGTQITLSTSQGISRLDVETGAARFARRSDGIAADLAAGQAAVISATIRPAPRDCPAGAPLVTGFTLVDVDTGRPVPGYDPIPEGATLDLGALPARINIRASTLPATVGSVVFAFDGNASFNVQNGPPYAAYASGDKGRWQPWALAPGAHALTATPFTAPRGGGAAGGALTLPFRVGRR